MTELIMEHPHNLFMRMCENADASIKLCAPYVKYPVIDEMMAKKRAETKLSLITNINLPNFHKKSSDITAIKKTMENGGTVYNCTSLHAKFYIFDDARCLITSANLTPSGLTRNIECGVCSDDIYLVRELSTQYRKFVLSDQVGKITERHIAEMEDMLCRLPTPPKISYPQYRLTFDNASDTESISGALTGWKKHIFLKLNALPNNEFSSRDVAVIAEQMGAVFPRNRNREAKVRQVLQQLRDIGLFRFAAPGSYEILWRGE